MKRLQELLQKYLNENLKKMIISNPRDRKKAAKISLRPVLLKEGLAFQACEYLGNKVYHKNFPKQKAILAILGWAEEYRQLDIFSRLGQATVLISKKGKVTVKEKAENGCMGEVDLSHNRKKKYILDPGEKVGFLIDLGVQSPEGKIVHAKYDKFRQINRFLEFIEDILPQLPKDREVTIVDFGCGKSYLTFAMYHYLKVLKGYQVHIIGLDLKEDVIAECSRLAGKYGYQGLDFYVGDIAHFQGVEQVDMVVTLHACDTATDYALDKAIRWGARVILSVPCCQHELNGQMENALLEPLFCYGLIKERMAALVTDALRGQILESRGYQVQLLEFIDMEHTPKNILIRAVKKREAEKQQEENLQLTAEAKQGTMHPGRNMEQTAEEGTGRQEREVEQAAEEGTGRQEREVEQAAEEEEGTGWQEREVEQAAEDREMEQAAEEDKGIGEGYRRVMEFLHVSPMLAVLQDRKEEKQNA